MFPEKKKRSTVPVVRRTPGQSLREEWDRLISEKLPFVVFVPCMLWFVWVTHWLNVGNKNPLSPRFWLGSAIVVTGIAAIAYLRLIPKARRLVRGERGELRVAEVLDDLRSFGYRPFHDLKRDGFNIDHVVVGPAGVFAVETKFRSGGGEIEFRNGEGLFVDGYPDEKDCLKQARGNAREVNRIIRENCGFNEWVWPLVVFVGDWHVKNDWQTTDARVFTAETLARHIVNQQPRLKQSEIALIASHLDRSVKS
jgi:hypothetical protein